MKKHTLHLLAVSATYFALGSAFAADAASTTTAAMTANATGSSAGTTADAVTAGRIASRFESLAGSTENAASLVAGLRSGSEITLASPDAATGVVFTPTTRPMGYGSITRALSLAQRQLAAQGVTKPTPTQLNAALNGGTLTTVDGSGASQAVEMAGVLQLRSQGMGWGQIAHQLDVSSGNRPLPVSTSMAPSAQAGVDLRGSSHGQGAIVSGDGGILHGRAPGQGGAAHGSAQVQTRTAAQAGAGMHVQTGRPPFATTNSSVGIGNLGTTRVQLGGNGRL